MKKFVIAAVLLVALAMVPGVMADDLAEGIVGNVAPTVTATYLGFVESTSPLVYNASGPIDIGTEVWFKVFVTDNNGISGQAVTANVTSDWSTSLETHRSFESCVVGTPTVAGAVGTYMVNVTNENPAAPGYWDFEVKVVDTENSVTNTITASVDNAYTVLPYTASKVVTTDTKVSLKNLVPGQIISSSDTKTVKYNTNVKFDGYGAGSDLLKGTDKIQIGLVYLHPTAPVAPCTGTCCANGLVTTIGNSRCYDSVAEVVDGSGGFCTDYELDLKFGDAPGGAAAAKLPVPLPAGTYTGSWDYMICQETP